LSAAAAAAASERQRPDAAPSCRPGLGSRCRRAGASRSRAFAFRTASSTARRSAWSSTRPTIFVSFRAARLDEPVVSGGRSGLGFDRLQLVGGAYRTPAGKLLLDGTPLPRSIGLLGVRAEQAWGKNAFWGIEANRAARGGGVGGYAEVLGTFGLEEEIVRDALTVGGRVAVGAGGGGQYLDRWRPACQGRRLRHRAAHQRARRLARKPAWRARRTATSAPCRARPRWSGPSTARTPAAPPPGLRAPTSAPA